MAAPSQSSPNQPVQKHSGAASEAAASVPPEVKAPPAESNNQQTSEKQEESASDEFVYPSYANTEVSEAYKQAKALLAEGRFDESLSTIEEAITKTLSLLPESEENGVHPSLGPLHYLYGTTLLYSVEESEDSPETNMVVNNASGGENGTASEESVGDLEIAWENLESARHIVENLVATPDATDKLKLDLAQIHLRLGDLQRIDGRYMEAISDYKACLELREPILGAFNRSVADSRYMLAMVNMMLASEGDRQQEKISQGEQLPPTVTLVPPDHIEEYRCKSIEHYLSSARSIAGTIALSCGADPDVITAEAPPQPSGGGKTTGLDPSLLSFQSCSHNLRAIRDRVTSLLQSKTDCGDSSVKTLAEMLDEIQEIVDEADNTKQGLHDVSKMTAKVHAQIAAADKEESMPVESSSEAGATTIGFGAAGAAAAASAAPVMAVKKKKKRPDLDTKLPAQDDPKRAKTE